MFSFYFTFGNIPTRIGRWISSVLTCFSSAKHTPVWGWEWWGPWPAQGPAPRPRLRLKNKQKYTLIPKAEITKEKNSKDYPILFKLNTPTYSKFPISKKKNIIYVIRLKMSGFREHTEVCHTVCSTFVCFEITKTNDKMEKCIFHMCDKGLMRLLCYKITSKKSTTETSADE